MGNKENKSNRVLNATKQFAIAEHLVKNIDCASNYSLKIFKTIKIFIKI